MKSLLIFLLAVLIPNGEQIKEWCKEGQKCIEKGDGIGAAQYYHDCCEAIGTGRSVIPLSASLYNIAKLYEDAGDFEEAEKYIQRSIGLGVVLGRTGSYALRYYEASRIYAALGRKEEAMEFARKGLDVAYDSHNENTIGQLLIQMGDCYADYGQYEKTDSLYKEAVSWLYKQGKGKLFVPEAYIKLGQNAEKAGDMKKARFYYESMLEETRNGYNQLQMYTACQQLAELLFSSDPAAASAYRTKADSLDFAPMVEALGINVALSNIEFPRIENELQLKSQRQRARLLLIIAILALLSALLLFSNVFTLKRHLKVKENQNADLIKANLQKDALLAIASSAVKEAEEVRRISEDVIPMPEVKLTRREMEIARLTAQGKLNKEIADELGISVGTVSVHKNNLFRKLGIGNTVELVRYMQKIGL